ncbi:MAG TPA: hypothetical protein VK638_22670, partial [Edaphobacter sp.]|nr:hypothetical protein [Edaphobacter sp.]
PPTRQMTDRSRLSDTASYSIMGNQEDRDDSQSAALSPKVSKMMTMLADRQEIVAKMRIRAAEVGQ